MQLTPLYECRLDSLVLESVSSVEEGTPCEAVAMYAFSSSLFNHSLSASDSSFC